MQERYDLVDRQSLSVTPRGVCRLNRSTSCRICFCDMFEMRSTTSVATPMVMVIPLPLWAEGRGLVASLRSTYT